ncbi:Uncharacterized protein dnm_001530 [Desulfonema magnum]|uniref:Uncharacterized protein n=1 Tax=Desulfonema magnum TaxID=45655 RepID=A0A975BFK9_9BACT|nr:Uncharacterized protein dnm_001530 [Desulfonema magnum]
MLTKPRRGGIFVAAGLLPDGVCNPVRNVCRRRSENIPDGVANPVRQNQS